MDTLLEKRKRLLYRSLHRGCKEMDVILGNFALHHIYLLSAEEINEYEKVVDTNDYQLYKYIVGEELVPEYLNSNLMKNIVDFNRSLVMLRFSK